MDFVCFVKLEQICRNFSVGHTPMQFLAHVLFNWSFSQQIVRREGIPLFEWTADTYKFESTLCCDWIYAPLGLSSEDSRDVIVPEYSSRTSEILLSTGAICHLLVQQKRLLPLQSGYHETAVDLDVPSQGSDWSTSRGTSS